MLKKIIFITAILSRSLSFAQDNDINSLILNGNYNLAIQKVNNVLIDHPENINARFQYATILSLTQKSDAAIEEFQKIIRINPNLIESYNNIAVIYAQQGFYEKAEEYLKKAIELNPKYNVAIENLGDLYIKMALQTYKKVLANDLNNENTMIKYIKVKSLSIDLGTNNIQKIIKN